MAKASRLGLSSNDKLGYIRYFSDFPYFTLNDIWTDTLGQNQFGGDKIYVVQTGLSIIRRCILMTTDPGDLVLDPTCGSGTTAYVAEQWGRRWITIDTSRVALALARARLMGARFPYYLMADSEAGAAKAAALSQTPVAPGPYGANIRLGFVYERVPHITLKNIANNEAIDPIWDKWQRTLEPLRGKLNELCGEHWQEWEIPSAADEAWSTEARAIHGQWRQGRQCRQQEIDTAIAASAECEYLYDRPYEDKSRVRVAGPFTVESISPYRVLGVDAEDNLLDPARRPGESESRDYMAMILDNLRVAGVQQAQKGHRITFSSVEPFPAGNLICAEGRYEEGEAEKRAAIFIGPEFGTVSREDIVEAAREAGDEQFDILIACAFNFEANVEELKSRGYLPILKARMNAELHMTEALRKTDKGNLFVVFGEPDLEIIVERDQAGAETGQIMVKIHGVDVYNPAKGEIVSDNADDIACWLLDTNYNEESFFVRQAYFLGQKNPYDALRRSLNAEIDREMWESLNSSQSRPFPKPASGRIAVKVINHLGDEVMKVFKI